MRAVVITSPGGPEVLEVKEVEDPAVGQGDVLIRVTAAGLNRADTLQRKGFHPAPPGASSYPGLECSGVVEAVGQSVDRWKIGDQVCSLIAGGGYAEKVAVPAGQVLPVPAGVSLEEAAALPEVACTVWSTVFMTNRLSPGESFLVGIRRFASSISFVSLNVSSVKFGHGYCVLRKLKSFKVHGGSSGIGTFAIQIAKHIGARVFTTAGSAQKLEFCKNLGADVCINYKTEDFVARVQEETDGKGVDVILDNMGGSYLQRNIASLNVDGRLFIIGFQGGAVTEVNLGPLLAKRLTVQAAGLRSRSTEDKARIVAEVEKHVWPAIAAGRVKPVIYKSFPLAEAADAHRLMESSEHVGKILLLP